MNALPPRRRNRLGALFTFALLVIIGRQFTPHTSSASGWAAPVVTPRPDSDPQAFVERTPGPGAVRYRVFDAEGRVLADGLTSAQLAYHFPSLNPGPGVWGRETPAEATR